MAFERYWESIELNSSKNMDKHSRVSWVHLQAPYLFIHFWEGTVNRYREIAVHGWLRGSGIGKFDGFWSPWFVYIQRDCGEIRRAYLWICTRWRWYQLVQRSSIKSTKLSECWWEELLETVWCGDSNYATVSWSTVCTWKQRIIQMCNGLIRSLLRHCLIIFGIHQMFFAMKFIWINWRRSTICSIVHSYQHQFVSFVLDFQRCLPLKWM